MLIPWIIKHHFYNSLWQTSIGRHLATCGLDNMQIQIIDSVKEGEHMALLNLEGYWQNILATFVEKGNINIRDELRELGQQPNY